MGVIANQSLKGAIANYLGVAIGFVTTFFVLTNCLSQEEIGLTRVMVDAAMLFSGLAQLGTNASIIRFFPYFKSSDGFNHGIFGWSVLIPFIGFVLFAVAFFLFRTPLLAAYAKDAPLLVDYFYLLLPLTFFALYMTVFETNASILLKITVPKAIREIGIRLFNLVCYLLYGRGIISLDTFVWLFCGSYALAMLLNLGYLLSLGNISFRIDRKFLSHGLLRDIVRYTLFMTVTILAGNIPLINSLFLGAKTGLALTGVYTIAFYIANVVEVPYRSLGAISRPLVASAVKEENWREVNRLSQQVSLHQFLVASLLFFFICINLKPLFGVIPNGAEYVGGMGVVMLMGGAKIVNSSLSISTDILNYSRLYAYSLVLIVVLTASAIFFNQWFIPLYGISGAALATLCSYTLYFALMLTFLRSKLRVSIFSQGQLKVVLLLALLWVCNMLWELLMEGLVKGLFADALVAMLVDAVLRSGCLLVLAVVGTYRMHISDEVNRFLDRLLRRK